MSVMTSGLWLGGCGESEQVWQAMGPPEDLAFAMKWSEWQPLVERVEHVRFANPKQGWALIDRDGTYSVALTTDAGKTWEDQHTLDGARSDWSKIKVETVDNHYFVMYGGGGVRLGPVERTIERFGLDGERQEIVTFSTRAEPVMAWLDRDTGWYTDLTSLYKIEVPGEPRAIAPMVSVITRDTVKGRSSSPSRWNDVIWPDEMFFFEDARGWLEFKDHRPFVTAAKGDFWRVPGLKLDHSNGQTESLRPHIFRELSPVDADTAFAVTSIRRADNFREEYRVIRTQDAGETWETISVAPEGRRRPSGLVGFNADSAVWLESATPKAAPQLARYENAEVVRKPLYGGHSSVLPIARTLPAAGNSFLYASTDGFFFTSSDGGETWDLLNDPREALDALRSEEDLRSGHVTFSVQNSYTLPKFQLTVSNSTHWILIDEGGPYGMGGRRIDWTSDNGETWNHVYIDEFPIEMFGTIERRFVIAGTDLKWYPDSNWDVDDPLPIPTKRVVGKIQFHSPYVSEMRYAERWNGKVTLRWRLEGDNGLEARCAEVAFSQPGPHGPATLPGKPQLMDDGWYQLVFNPGALVENRRVEFHVRIETTVPEPGAAPEGADQNRVDTLQSWHRKPLVYNQAIVKADGSAPFVYRPWLDRVPGWVKGLGIAAGLAFIYLGIGLCVMLISPASLPKLHQRLPADRVAEIARIPGVGPVAELVFALVSLERLSKSARCRRAWLALYRAGRVAYEDLPAPIAEAYFSSPDGLDAFVDTHVETARKAFEAIDTVRQRPAWIPLPIRVTEHNTEHHLDAPRWENFLPWMPSEPFTLTIRALGGAGKSTLAIDLARYRLTHASRATDAQSPHCMIPVLIEEETTDLRKTVLDILSVMIGTESIDELVYENLIKQGRVLVIVDAISERSREMQDHVVRVRRDLPVNAMIVTTRNPIRCEGGVNIEVEPELMTADNVPYFVTRYLQQSNDEHGDRRGLFSAEDVLGLAARVLALVKGSVAQRLTPLLIKIFTDQACDLRRAGRSLNELGTNVGEIVLDDIRRTNPSGADAGDGLSADRAVVAAKIAARVSLGDRYTPGRFRADAFIAELPEDLCGLQETGFDILGCLVSNGQLQVSERAGVKHYAFMLDPICEYLGAMDLIDRFNANANHWDAWLDELAAGRQDRPSATGFVAILENCYLAYAQDFDLPDTLQEELARAVEAERLSGVAGVLDE